MHSFFMFKREINDEQRSPNASPVTMGRARCKHCRKQSSKPMTLINGARDPRRKFRQVHRECFSEHLGEFTRTFQIEVMAPRAIDGHCRKQIKPPFPIEIPTSMFRDSSEIARSDQFTDPTEILSLCKAASVQKNEVSERFFQPLPRVGQSQSCSGLISGIIEKPLK